MKQVVVGSTGGGLVCVNALSVFVIAGSLVLFSSHAWAKACIDTRNDGAAFGKWDPSAMTTVKNATASTSIRVEIFRGGDSKQEKFLAPGEDTNYTASLGGQARKGTIRVQLHPEGSAIAPECRYTVEESSSGSRLDWALPDGVNSVCPDPGDIAIACDLDFHKEKYRWHTVFTVRDR